jgi:fibro-slime domain-containing protein
MKKLLVLSALALAGSAALASTITLNGTVRDFAPGALVPGSTNPDFQKGVGGLQTGMVKDTLGVNGKPVLNAVDGSIPANWMVTSNASFAEWFGDDAPRKSLSIDLTETAPGSGVYSFSDSSFFPINGQLLGNYQSTNKNYHFTYQISGSFGYKAGTGQTFSFTGDDDVWVFFDKKLGIDLGGVHSAITRTVNLDTLMAGKASGNYSFDFFFAERHTTQSNLMIQTSLELVAPPIPEPSTYALMALGLAAVGAAARRRRAQA